MRFPRPDWRQRQNPVEHRRRAGVRLPAWAHALAAGEATVDQVVKLVKPTDHESEPMFYTGDNKAVLEALDKQAGGVTTVNPRGERAERPQEASEATDCWITVEVDEDAPQADESPAPRALVI